jgi:hypothetical protein
VTPKLTRRAAAKVAAAIVAAPSLASEPRRMLPLGMRIEEISERDCEAIWAAAHVVEPDSEIRPVLPFSEEQARALTRPIAEPRHG